MPRRSLAAAVAVTLATTLLLASCSSTPSAPSAAPATGAAGRGDTTAQLGAAPALPAALDLRPLSVSDDLRIVDDEGRDVLLRGVNVTSLGEYWQGDPNEPPTLPTTDADWAEMASRGLSVVRLVVHWSRIEPERGTYDEAYLDEVDDYVRAAADHGIYTVIDMHQDAYSAFIATEDAAACPEGTEPGKGWDGAPRWATITDGLSTCVTGDRNSAPAVVAAWNHFYDDTDGIRTAFADAWGHVAARFAGRSEVAGYDLLNEPEVSRPAGELTPRYDALLVDVIGRIRDAEAGAPFEHLLFVEPAIPAGDPAFGLVVPDPVRAGIDVRDVVAAPHNYAESIDVGDVTIEDMNQLFLRVATGLGAATWIGEYGWWDTGPESLAELARFAADQDRLALGGAWWQWRQPCGDPHSVPWGGWGGTTDTIVHLHRLGCPGGEDLGPTDAFLDVLGRGYPRATPGRITALTSDPASGTLTVEAEAGEAGGQLVVWTPTDAATHPVSVTGLDGVEEVAVAGGRYVTARVAAPGPYRLVVGPAAVGTPR